MYNNICFLLLHGKKNIIFLFHKSQRHYGLFCDATRTDRVQRYFNSICSLISLFLSLLKTITLLIILSPLRRLHNCCALQAEMSCGNFNCSCLSFLYYAFYISTWSINRSNRRELQRRETLNERWIKTGHVKFLVSHKSLTSVVTMWDDNAKYIKASDIFRLFLTY